MEMLPVTPERKAELDDYAHRHGKDSAAALDEALASFLGWERQDYQESLAAIRRGYEDVKAGRTRPATEFLEQLREKHGFPRLSKRRNRFQTVASIDRIPSQQD